VGEGRPAGEAEVEELLRLNAELAAELRAIATGRDGEPRRSPLPAARRVARIVEERDSLAARLEQAQAQVEATRAELAVVSEERDWLRRHVEELHEEVVRLRSGLRGLLRRARARLLGA
jgi:predicted nuclease with TOPRIM domain